MPPPRSAAAAERHPPAVDHLRRALPGAGGGENPRRGAGLPWLCLRLSEKVWADAVGFCGSELIRRSVGLSHVADIDTIQDDAMRHECLRHAITLGRALIVLAERIDSVDEAAGAGTPVQLSAPVSSPQPSPTGRGSTPKKVPFSDCPAALRFAGPTTAGITV